VKGAAYTVLNSCVDYVTSQQGKVSEVRHRQSLLTRDIKVDSHVSVTNQFRISAVRLVSNIKLL